MFGLYSLLPLWILLLEYRVGIPGLQALPTGAGEMESWETDAGKEHDTFPSW
jgi:hypothetical protein